MPTIRSFACRRQARTLAPASSDGAFQNAVAFAVAFVRAQPLCRIDVLGANLGSTFGSAMWRRINAEIVRKEHQLAHSQQTIWCDGAGRLALDKATLLPPVAPARSSVTNLVEFVTRCATLAPHHQRRA